MEDTELVEEPISYPEDGEIIGRYNLVIDRAKKMSDGFWEIVRTIKQTVSFDGSRWFIREKSIKAIDRNFVSANKTTHNAVANLLAEYKDDFFSKGEWDGNQYVMDTPDNEKVLAEEYHGIVESV